jgi:intracellular sulfur oxidation DsrE/DsrF family protein
MAFRGKAYKMNILLTFFKKGIAPFAIVCLLVSPSWSALERNPQFAKIETHKQILYTVSSIELNKMKDSLIQINLHLRENADQKKPQVMVAIYGPGVQFFRKGSIDAELRFMLKWFYEEDVIVGVSKNWLEKLKMVTDDLADGLAVLEPTQPFK